MALSPLMTPVLSRSAKRQKIGAAQASFRVYLLDLEVHILTSIATNAGEGVQGMLVYVHRCFEKVCEAPRLTLAFCTAFPERVEWARNQAGWPSHFDNVITIVAARHGHLNTLESEFLRDLQNGCPFNSEIFPAAAEGGHLHVLKWAREKGFQWDTRTCAAAARGGHLEVIKWALENGCIYSRKILWEAAGEGHLEVLKWAWSNSYSFDPMTCASAARHGHLEVVQWFRDTDPNECFSHGTTLAAATSGGHKHVIDWLQELVTN